MRILNEGYEYVLKSSPKDEFIKSAKLSFDEYSSLYEAIKNNLILEDVESRILSRGGDEDLLEKYCNNLMACYYLYFNYYKPPILKIHNKELIKMLMDTDIDFSMVKDIQLPFERFYIEADVDDTGDLRLEYLIEKHESGISIVGSSTLGKQASFIFTAGYFENLATYKHLPLYLSNILAKDKSLLKNRYWDLYNRIEDELDIFNKTLLPILFFLSTKKTQKIIKEKSENIMNHSRQIASESDPVERNPSVNKNYFIPFYLFNDVKYVMNGNDSSKLGLSGRKNASHLVRGHFRNQPYGSRKQGSVTYEIIWIAPYFTGDGLVESKVYIVK